MKKKDLVEWQKIRVRDARKNESARSYERWKDNKSVNLENSGQWGAAFKHQISLGEPDILGSQDEEPITALEQAEIDNENKNKVEKLMIEAKKLLTDKEYEVFILLTQKYLSFAVAASRLSKKYDLPVTKSAVQSTWNHVLEKLRKVKL